MALFQKKTRVYTQILTQDTGILAETLMRTEKNG